MYCIAAPASLSSPAAVQLDAAAPERLGGVRSRLGGVGERGGGVRRLGRTSAESDVSPESGNALRFGMAPCRSAQREEQVLGGLEPKWLRKQKGNL
jgi:hypothetical protein